METRESKYPIYNKDILLMEKYNFHCLIRCRREITSRVFFFEFYWKMKNDYPFSRRQWCSILFITKYLYSTVYWREYFYAWQYYIHLFVQHKYYIFPMIHKRIFLRFFNRKTHKTSSMEKWKFSHLYSIRIWYCRVNHIKTHTSSSLNDYKIEETTNSAQFIFFKINFIFQVHWIS